MLILSGCLTAYIASKWLAVGEQVVPRPPGESTRGKGRKEERGDLDRDPKVCDRSPPLCMYIRRLMLELVSQELMVFRRPVLQTILSLRYLDYSLCFIDQELILTHLVLLLVLGVLLLFLY